MEIGNRVKVLPYDDYRGKYNGCLGIIEKHSGNKFGVRLDDYWNRASSVGLFWISKNRLEEFEQEEDTVINNFKIAGINFLEGTNVSSTYFYALYDEDIEVGDIVVVKSAHHGMGIAKIVSIDTRNPKVVTNGREIICKADFSAYEKRNANRKRAKELKQMMDKKVKELQEYAIFEMLANQDSELGDMLAEYKELIK